MSGFDSENRYNNKLEACNRCCSGNVSFSGEYVLCENCGLKEKYDNWQLIGWRNIKLNPPVFTGKIFIYGKEIGRGIANWNSVTQLCDNDKATHWLRVPEPTKQINFKKE